MYECSSFWVGCAPHYRSQKLRERARRPSNDSITSGTPTRERPGKSLSFPKHRPASKSAAHTWGARHAHQAASRIIIGVRMRKSTRSAGTRSDHRSTGVGGVAPCVKALDQCVTCDVTCASRPIRNQSLWCYAAGCAFKPRGSLSVLRRRVGAAVGFVLLSSVDVSVVHRNRTAQPNAKALPLRAR